MSNDFQGEMKTLQSEPRVHSTGLRWFKRAIQFAIGAGLALSSVGCAAQARYSLANLHAMAPNAGIVDVCTHFPMGDPEATVVAYDSSTRTAVSDGNWEAFTEFAKTKADFIYRYDPSMPDETASLLPEPYKTMTCRTLSAAKTPPLPKGMKELQLTREMREALMSALIDRASLSLRAPRQDNAARSQIFNKQFLSGGFVTGPYVDRRSPSERLEAAGQMLRDAIRAVLPNVPGPKNEQVSIIDTDAGQVIGGFGAGAAIGTVPGGVFIADAMQNSPDVPKPTPQFNFGQGVGQMGSGLLQVGGGGTLMAGGAGMSATGVGLVAGVPTCTAGVMLAANGTITFLNGAHTVLIALCNWHELDNMQPLAAVAPNDAPAPAPPSQPAAPAPAPKPPPAPVQAAPVKPVVAPPLKAPPAKPAPVKPPPKSTEPIVVRTSPGGTKTTTRPRLKEGQEPCDITLKVRTDEAGKVQSMEVDVKPAALLPYNKGKGHHPVAKRSLEGAPNYDAHKALAIPKAELENMGIKHGDISVAQMKRYMDFGKNNKVLTWEDVARIETASLVDARMDPKMAQATVTKAIQALKDSNVASPVRIPWVK